MSGATLPEIGVGTKVRPTSFVTFEVERFSDTGKTVVWRVLADDGGSLGTVKWFGRWRCYAFHPTQQTIFERTCLRDIADFCEQESRTHLKAKAHRRPHV